MSEPSAPLSAEDAKLVTLARATRARTGAAEGAAVRDENGRTYAAATVELPSLRLSALEVCVAMAIASGSRGLEAAVVLTEAERRRRPRCGRRAGRSRPGGAPRRRRRSGAAERLGRRIRPPDGLDLPVKKRHASISGRSRDARSPRAFTSVDGMGPRHYG